MYPADEKMASEGTLVAGITRYLRAMSRRTELGCSIQYLIGSQSKDKVSDSKKLLSCCTTSTNVGFRTVFFGFFFVKNPNNSVKFRKEKMKHDTEIN